MFERILPFLPMAYLASMIAALISVIVIGIVPTPLEILADSGSAAALLRSLCAFFMPLAFTLFLGVSWRGAQFWALVLIMGALMVLTAPLPANAAIATAAYLLWKDMLPSTPAETALTSWSGLLWWIVGIIAFTFALRLLALDEPFERDLMAYSMVASSWLQGAELYSETWGHKPPALYVVYASAIAVLGQSPVALLALGIGAFVATLLGIKVAAERLAGPGAALLAMLAWAVFGNDLILQAQQPNVEVFISACLIWALAVLIPVARDPDANGAILLAGGLFFLASAFKQIAVFPAVLAGIWLLWLHLRTFRQDGRSHLISGIRAGALLALPGLLGWAVIVFSFAAFGDFEEFWYGAFGYNQSYAGSVLFNMLWTALRDVRDPYYIAVFLGLILLCTTFRDRRVAILMASAYIGCAVMVAAPGKNFPHYYQLLLPVMAVGYGAHMATFVPAGKRVVAALLTLAPIWISFGYFTSPERLAYVKYGERGHGGASVESREIGRWISRNVPPEQTVFHWGAEPGVYFWSGRPTEYRFVYNYPLFGGPRRDEFLGDVLTELACDPPDVVVPESVS